MHEYGENKTTRIMMPTVRHVTSSSGLRKFQAAWFLLKRGYIILHQLIWITGSLQCVRISSKKTEVSRLVSQLCYVLDGCVTCKHTIPLQTEPKTNSATMLAGHSTSCRFVSCWCAWFRRKYL